MSMEQLGLEPIRLTEEKAIISFLRVAYMLDAAMGMTPIEFGYMDEPVQAAWIDAYNKAREVVADAAGVDGGRKIDDLARISNHAFQCSLNSSELVAWQDILPAYRLKWQFLIRHMAIILEWTSDEDDIIHVEEQLVGMFKEHLDLIPQSENSDASGSAAEKRKARHQSHQPG